MLRPARRVPTTSVQHFVPNHDRRTAHEGAAWDGPRGACTSVPRSALPDLTCYLARSKAREKPGAERSGSCPDLDLSQAGRGACLRSRYVGPRDGVDLRLSIGATASLVPWCFASPSHGVKRRRAEPACKRSRAGSPQGRHPPLLPPPVNVPRVVGALADRFRSPVDVRGPSRSSRRLRRPPVAPPGAWSRFVPQSVDGTARAWLAISVIAITFHNMKEVRFAVSHSLGGRCS